MRVPHRARQLGAREHHPPQNPDPGQRHRRHRHRLASARAGRLRGDPQRRVRVDEQRSQDRDSGQCGAHHRREVGDRRHSRGGRELRQERTPWANHPAGLRTARGGQRPAPDRDVWRDRHGVWRWSGLHLPDEHGKRGLDPVCVLHSPAAGRDRLRPGAVLGAAASAHGFPVLHRQWGVRVHARHRPSNSTGPVRAERDRASERGPRDLAAVSGDDLELSAVLQPRTVVRSAAARRHRGRGLVSLAAVPDARPDDRAQLECPRDVPDVPHRLPGLPGRRHELLSRAGRLDLWPVLPCVQGSRVPPEGGGRRVHVCGVSRLSGRQRRRDHHLWPARPLFAHGRRGLRVIRPANSARRARGRQLLRCGGHQADPARWAAQQHLPRHARHREPARCGLVPI